MDIRLFEDLNLENVTARQNYYSYFLVGDYERAFEILRATPNIASQVLTKDNLNMLVGSLLQLEGYFQNGVTDFLSELLSRFQLNIDNLVFVDIYRPDYQYSINNFVIHNSELYFCYKTPPIGTIPENTEYWLYLGLRGNKGVMAWGLSYEGRWLDYWRYSKKVFVVYNNVIYVSRKNTTIGMPPPAARDEWLLGMQVIPQKIIVSVEEPPNLQKGAIWFRIIEDTPT